MSSPDTPQDSQRSLPIPGAGSEASSDATSGETASQTSPVEVAAADEIPAAPRSGRLSATPPEPRPSQRNSTSGEARDSDLPPMTIAPARPSTHQHPLHVHEAGVTPLAIAALGVVYGDIGTSPLYAVKECFGGEHAMTITEGHVLGILSLFFWSLLAVVVLKYLMFIMRADNHGEGGILALLALVPKRATANARASAAGPLVLLVLFGAALLYGDGVITPAISVLSAVEGLNVATDATKDFVVPITVGILLALFLVQKRGTAGIGKVFGPVMIVWFITIGVLGIIQIVKHPHILLAANPLYAIEFFREEQLKGYLVLGSVVLCVTGGEALYADMGHFGRHPIRVAWFAVVMPSLLLNYFGQGALLLLNPEAKSAPFYEMVPAWGLYPMVALATAATVIASQALISGAFSLTRQGVQLGYLPRVTVVHTSSAHEGQIYVPEVNNALMLACIALVIFKSSSDKLAAAYGLAVTGTMAITSIVYYVVITKAWGWSRWKALPLVLLFLGFDLAFFGANLVKFIEGGWIPVAMASGVFIVMVTWKTGRARLAEQIASRTGKLDAFLEAVRSNDTVRVKGTAVFMTANPNGLPPVLRHHWQHNQVLHEQVLLLSIQSLDVPFVNEEKRVTVDDIEQGFFQISARYGFMETPDIKKVLAAARSFGLVIDPATTTFYLGRETLITTTQKGMARWRKILFAFLSRNSRTATAYFNIPPDRVIEMGMQVEL